MRNKLSAKELVLRISELAQERMAQERVVSLNDFSKAKKPVAVPTILIIEDDETIRKSLKRIVEDMNYRVLDAKDAIEMAQIFGQREIHLILMDVGLPWVNGFELAQMMKEDVALKSVPLIFISGQSDTVSVKKGFSVGAHDFISKPFDIAQVKKSIQTLLKLNDVI